MNQGDALVKLMFWFMFGGFSLAFGLGLIIEPLVMFLEERRERKGE